MSKIAEIRARHDALDELGRNSICNVDAHADRAYLLDLVGRLVPIVETYFNEGFDDEREYHRVKALLEESKP